MPPGRQLLRAMGMVLCVGLGGLAGYNAVFCGFLDAGLPAEEQTNRATIWLAISAALLVWPCFQLVRWLGSGRAGPRRS